MARSVVYLLAALAVLAVGCGEKIGDECSINTDCSAENTRQCITDPSWPGGYCTVFGCDADSCPGESVCVQFYSVINQDKTCDQGCAVDEVCTLGNFCAPRATETRACMLLCGGQGDCREDYECRDLERMKSHGGEPLGRDGAVDSDHKFCAASLPCASDDDCDIAGDSCQGGYCQP